MSQSKSASGSFKDMLKNEVKKITDNIFKDSKHLNYLTHPLIKRENHVQRLVR